MDKQERIKFAVAQLFEQGNLDVVDEVFSLDYTAHAGNKDYEGHDFLKKYFKELNSAIPDIQVIQINFLLESDEMIAWQRTLSGTHKVNMRGIPASGTKIEWTEMVVSRFENEKIAKEWIVSDLSGQLYSIQSR